MNTNLAYEEEAWEELIDGKGILMSPPPSTTHNRVAFRIAYIFERYLEGKRCTVFADGTALYLSEKDHFIPDTMVVCDPDKCREPGVFGAPDLVVEVLSPSTAGRDRGYKKDTYAKYGVKEYWIVDPLNRTVEQYLLQEGAFTFHGYYALLDPEDRSEGEYFDPEFTCSLYDDLIIRLEDIFGK